VIKGDFWFRAPDMMLDFGYLILLLALRMASATSREQYTVTPDATSVEGVVCAKTPTPRYPISTIFSARP
jgi:hypothetical protein